MTPAGVARGAVLALAWSALASCVDAQSRVKPSQSGSVSQTVNQTEITLHYDRPVARGRELFGDLVSWDKIWTPGANRSTRIAFSTDVVVEGVPLEAGSYGIWTIPNAVGPWTFVLSREDDVFHTRYPGEENDVLRVRVEPTTASHMETLAWYFPVVESYATTLYLHWGETVLPIRIEVPEA